MTFINWLGLGLTGLILLSGIVLVLYFRKKKEELDGFLGILNVQPQDKQNSEDKSGY